MKVYRKSDDKLIDVYDIQYDSNGYPLFLYYENGCWLRSSAKYFTPDKPLSVVKKESKAFENLIKRTKLFEID